MRSWRRVTGHSVRLPRVWERRCARNLPKQLQNKTRSTRKTSTSFTARTTLWKPGCGRSWRPRPGTTVPNTTRLWRPCCHRSMVWTPSCVMSSAHCRRITTPSTRNMQRSMRPSFERRRPSSKRSCRRWRTITLRLATYTLPTLRLWTRNLGKRWPNSSKLLTLSMTKHVDSRATSRQDCDRTCRRCQRTCFRWSKNTRPPSTKTRNMGRSCERKLRTSSRRTT
mmetsp:Transcript_29356/g.77581  ORF Transcript_29356/g.77581 Transcript_29356/m.77581 type:complete len:224 (+) Transcript_29356:891-1562(+)